ncbi:MAG: NAD kinase [Microbacteriaceae bacterium]|nr:NAD kinase [Microbacteriaceae bacterium]
MTATRRALVIPHVLQDVSLATAIEVCRQLVGSGVVPVLREAEGHVVASAAPDLTALEWLESGVALHEVDVVFAIGGDGTILRAAEVVRDVALPIVGVNVGHIGFLAETERDSVSETVSRVLAGDFAVEDLFCLDVRVKRGNEVVFHTWALNEATVEKASRERMLEVVVEVNKRPLESFGCDGIVVATPTGSTAYAFSAGGPVVWPDVEAMLVVPLSAHALFARPLVVSPDVAVAVEILERSSGGGVLWCDGRRTFDLPSGARVVVQRSTTPVRLARLNNDSFADRIVNKFDLSVYGWRGPQ